jgi:hypothetical protein
MTDFNIVGSSAMLISSFFMGGWTWQIAGYCLLALSANHSQQRDALILRL